MTSVSAHAAPPDAPLADGVTLAIDGIRVPIYRCRVLDYAIVNAAPTTAHPCEVVITLPGPIGTALVRPAHRGVQPQVVGNRLVFTVDRPRQLYIEMAHRPPLAVFIDLPETWHPEPGRDCVIFPPGLHRPGAIDLAPGQTLYLADGAYVHGYVRAPLGDRVAIRGRGILDGSQLPSEVHRLVEISHGRDVLIEGITTVGTPGWNLRLLDCSQVGVANIKNIGWVVGSDGIDVVSCRDVVIADCFLRSNDDCIVVKAFDWKRVPSAPPAWSGDVANVQVVRCICYNDQAGNALEIGFETTCSSITGIRFEDIDIIGAHGEGGVFTIHNGDRARIEDVRYHDIRVEHFYDRLIDLRVLDSRWSRDTERGTIRHVHFSAIRTCEDIFNTPSLIGGFDAAHPIEDVLIEDMRIGHRRVQTADDLHLFTSHLRGLVIR